MELKESIQYHNFFLKLYGNGNKDDFCYGMGLKVPRVPFLFQAIPEKRSPPPNGQKINSFSLPLNCNLPT